MRNLYFVWALLLMCPFISYGQSPGCQDLKQKPIYMDFEAHEDFSDWKIVDANNDSVSWQIMNNANVPASMPYGARHGDQFALYLANPDSVTPADDWIFSPCMHVDSGRAYVLCFTFCASKDTTRPHYEAYSVYFSRAQDPSTTFRRLTNRNVVHNTYPNYNRLTSFLPAFETGDVHVAFQVRSDAGRFAFSMDSLSFIDRAFPTATTQQVTDEPAYFEVYPNPTSDALNIDLAFDTPQSTLHVSMYNMLGQEVKQQTLKQVGIQRLIWDVSSYSKGAYVLRIFNGKTQYTRRVLIQ